MSIYKRVNELLGTEYKNDSEIDWEEIGRGHKLSENFIEEFKNEIDWSRISVYQILSEEFIERYKYYVDWNYISTYQILSWNFIMEHKYEVDWSRISLYQPFIENPEWCDVNTRLLDDNKLYYFYQRTKDRGWFIGYIYLGDKLILNNTFSIYPSYYFRIKSKIYWKNLIMINKVSTYEFIRCVKNLHL